MAGLNGLPLFGNLMKLQHLNTLSFPIVVKSEIKFAYVHQIKFRVNLKYLDTLKREIGFRVIMLNKFTSHNNTEAQCSQETGLFKCKQGRQPGNSPQWKTMLRNIYALLERGGECDLVKCQCNRTKEN